MNVADNGHKTALVTGEAERVFLQYMKDETAGLSKSVSG